MAQHGGQHHVKQDPANFGQGSIDPATVDHEGAMYLFKASAHVGLGIFAAVLSGDRAAVARVENDNLDAAGTYDPKGYSGNVKAAVDAYVAAKRDPRRHFVWP